MQQHALLRKLFRQKTNLPETLSLIEKQLTENIRFKGKVIFNSIQLKDSEKELNDIEATHKENSEMNEQIESWEDKFWE